MSTPSLVKVRDVHKHFTRGGERIDVLKGVQLDIPQGDFVALMGPSGSGKTTLLNLIGGLDEPASGTLTVAGERVDDMSESEMRDIIAFLEGLTDPNFDRTIPVRVPSKLPPGGSIQHP